jgi:hypothetical protein
VRDDKAFIDAWEELIAYAREPSRFSKSIRDKVLGTLGNLKRESNVGFGAKLAANLNGTYDGLSPADYFDRAYKRRSKLVDGMLADGLRLDSREIGGEIDILRKFVLDLLGREVEIPDQT